MLELELPDLRRCAACHDQCQFATVETFAAGSMVFDTSRKASLLIALAAGRLELSDRAIEVIYSGLSSGMQHSVCVYTGDLNGWPDEAVWLRAARAEVVRVGRAPAWALRVRDEILAAAAAFAAYGGDDGTVLVHVRGSISVEADPDGYGQLSSIAAAAGQDLGLLAGETGFELYDLGFVDEARATAKAFASRLVANGATTIICDAPEAAWMMRCVWPTWDIHLAARVVHVSQWLDSLVLIGRLAGTVRTGFHDPAVLARGLDEVDAPRRVIERSGVAMIEFLRSGKEALPAGSYYGSAQGSWVADLAIDRLDSALRLGMEQVIVASPYDLRSLVAGPIRVRTLHDVVASTLS